MISFKMFIIQFYKLKSGLNKQLRLVVSVIVSYAYAIVSCSHYCCDTT